MNETQLKGIIHEVLPALGKGGKFWVAYPKTSSKIATTLNRECSWTCITGSGYEMVRDVALDHVWTAVRFKKCAPIASSLISSLRAPLREAVLGESGTERVRTTKTLGKPVATARRSGAVRRPA